MKHQLKDFRQLIVWQQSHQLTLRIYKVTKTFPSDERFGIISQMRRAAISVSANIVEGFRRRNKGEKRPFYNISLASADELLYFLILSKDLGYLRTSDDEIQLIDSVSRMLSAMIKRTEQ